MTLSIQVPCIQFIDKETLNRTVNDYVLIVRSGATQPACYSQLGRMGGKQELGLNMRCFRNKDGSENIEVGVHELMHALGK